MKIACGIDIIEIDRIKENIDKLENKFLDKIFTQKEIQYCEGKKNKNINTMLQGLLLKRHVLKQYQKA